MCNSLGCVAQELNSLLCVGLRANDPATVAVGLQSGELTCMCSCVHNIIQSPSTQILCLSRSPALVVDCFFSFSGTLHIVALHVWFQPKAI